MRHVSGAEVLRLASLELGYGRDALLPAIDLSFRRGELWAILGHNGGGKTTLLRTILGLQPKLRGDVVWAGGRRHVGYVPQRSSLDDGLPARAIDIVRKGVHQDWSFLNPVGWLGKGDVIDQAMQETHTAAFRSRQFRTLSEGEKQRVLMAQALVNSPPMLILDEPTSAMDVHAERRTFELLDTLRVGRELAVLLVSHHLAVVAEFATHILLVDKDTFFVLSGTVDEVAAHPEWQRRFGRALESGLARRRGEGLSAPMLPAAEPLEVVLG